MRINNKCKIGREILKIMKEINMKGIKRYKKYMNKNRFLLYDITSWVKFLRFPIEFGKHVILWLYSIIRNFKFTSFPIFSGIICSGVLIIRALVFSILYIICNDVIK